MVRKGRIIGFYTRKTKDGRKVVCPITESRGIRSSRPVTKHGVTRSAWAWYVDQQRRARKVLEKPSEEWKKHPEVLDVTGVDTPEKSEKSRTIGAIATYNKMTGWLHIRFDSKPSKEVLEELKRAGFRYHPSTKTWRAAWSFEREKVAEKMAGDVETVSKAINYARLAGKMEKKAQKHMKLAEEYQKRAEGIMSAIPPGQPILVGHYSEKYHRRALERLHRYTDKAFEEREKAEYYQKRAEYYRRLATEGEDPEKVYRRIKRLESERRRWERELVWINIEKKNGKGFLRKYGIYTDDEDRVKGMLQRINERLQAEKEKFKALTGRTFEEVEKERKEESKRRGIEKRRQKVDLPFELKVGDIVNSPFGKAKVVKINPKTVVVEKDLGEKKVRFKVMKALIGKA